MVTNNLIFLIFAGIVLGGCFNISALNNRGDNKNSTQSIEVNTAEPPDPTASLIVKPSEDEGLDDVSLAIKPGSINISAEVYVGEGFPVATGFTGHDLGITINSAASKPVMVTSKGNETAKFASPMTLSLPLSALTLFFTLNKQSIIVVYRIYSDEGVKEGVIPNSKITIADGKSSFAIEAFGVYQLAYIPSSEKDKAESIEPIMSDRTLQAKKDTNLAAASISDVTKSVTNSGVATFSVSVGGGEVKKCFLDLINSSAILSIDMGAHTSITHTFTADYDGKARISCLLVDGRELMSAMIELNVVPVESPSYPVCGGEGDSCYEDTAAISDGVATTPSGKNLEYITASGVFMVWKEVGGNRVLRANGLDEWAKKLNLNGKGLSATDFTDYTSIVGRKCPPNVYIDDSNKFTTGNCLYYTEEAAQALNAAGTSQTVDGAIGLGPWTDYNGGEARWYVGNVQTCASRGMRLPTIFETSTTTTTQTYYPTTDGAPSFAGTKGIPSHPGGYTWTASASNISGDIYWIWSGASVSGQIYIDPIDSYLRCVLP